MKRYDAVSNAGLATADPTYQRLDLRQRDIVDHAIAVQSSSNTMSAIEYLKSHDVDAQVIERVLLEPAKRRNPLPH